MQLLYVALFAKSSLYKWPQRVTEQRPVSIIICAKNEADNLKNNLPQILQQDYAGEHGEPNYEVVVVNDVSTDETTTVLEQLQQVYPHLRIVNIVATDVRILKGKKHALSAGIKASKHEWLLLTDADCSPASHLWIATMTKGLAAGKEIVAGYGAYRPSPTLLNAFIRWETLHTYIQYSSYASIGLPYMAVGRNIACTKDILLQAQAAPQWNSTASGDDDMLVNTCATAENYCVQSDRNSFTYTGSKVDFGEWVRQKQRHLSTGKQYRTSIKYLLGTYGYTHAAFWFYLPFAACTAYSEYVLLLGLLRCGAYWTLMAWQSRRMGEKNLIRLLPLFDFGWMIYNFTFLPYIVAKNRQTWK